MFVFPMKILPSSCAKGKNCKGLLPLLAARIERTPLTLSPLTIFSLCEHYRLCYAGDTFSPDQTSVAFLFQKTLKPDGSKTTRLSESFTKICKQFCVSPKTSASPMASSSVETNTPLKPHIVDEVEMSMTSKYKKQNVMEAQRYANSDSDEFRVIRKNGKKLAASTNCCKSPSAISVSSALQTLTASAQQEKKFYTSDRFTEKKNKSGELAMGNT
ncbi:hypothetical protein EVAR_86776_1 [Eumeta japonica]|uniref:Uncharacterized protein n=1 Tax=Eumeta variegata TaxID=151549 RepID=A0A4C1W1W9_EUMVA|nr:hypothetical protein EVAR_86776_1 [Eumeta japonica]